jgi:RNA polymerase sigma-70 factor (ECF subfamily)
MDGRAAVVDASLNDERELDDPGARVAALFDAHHERLYRLARRLARSPEDPADLVQETFLRAARGPHRVPAGAASEEAWLVRVLINICRDGWRHAAVHGRALAEHRLPVHEPTDPEAGMLAHAMVWRALDTLPPRRRAILVLHELDGTPAPAIARLLGITPVTVRWHLMRGRREMARALGVTP